MKKIIFLFIAGFAFLTMKAQNLVQNPSFESINAGSLLCSWYVSQTEFNSAINNWSMPTNGSTDIFHTSLATSCFCSPYSTHASAVGQQAPRTGSSMSAVTTYGNGGCAPSYREYLQGQLSSPLVVGQQYCVEFYISMADYNTYASNNIGVYFSTSSIWSATMCPYSVTPHLNYTTINTNASGWTLVSFTFTPTQAYSYFMIGNFYADASTSITNVGGSRGVSRYFIDDVSVQLCSTNPTVTVNNATICAGQTATLTANSNISGTTFAWSNGSSGSSISVNPATTTTYTVTGTSPSGGTGTASATVTVNPVPTVTASASPASICQGQASSLSASGASTYAWSTGASGSPLSVSPGTTTTYTVTGTSAAGCTNTANVTVTVNAAPTITTTGAAVCQGNAATISASGAVSYLWSNGSTLSSISVSPSTTTSYTVTGTNAAGCTSTATATVTVNPLPVISVSASPSAVCPGNLSVVTASGASTYAWSTGATGSTINVNPVASSTYTVTGTSAAGCTSSGSVNVSVLAGPVVSVNNAVICMGENASLTASGAVNYTWSNGAAGATVSVSPLSTTTYTVSGTDGSGCTGVANATVTVNPLPVVSASQPSICSGQQATITASGAIDYIWSTGDITSSIVVSPLTTMTYTVSGTDANGCSNSAQALVTVNPIPIVDVLTTDDYCSSSNGTAQALVTSGSIPYQYSWNSVPVQSTDLATGLAAGTYVVTVTDANGCTAQAQGVVNAQPGFSATASTEAEHCGHADGSILVSVSGATLPLSYTWSHNAALNQPSADLLAAGAYTVTISDGQCTQIISASVTEIEGPVAGFHPSSLVVDPDAGAILFSDLSTGAIGWMYDFGDGSTSTLQNPEYQYSLPGVYLVMQLVYDSYGCLDSAFQEITVNEGFALYIPSAFSPNGDGRNDFFTLSGYGIDPNTFCIDIYDRWGRIVFRSTDINAQWDGQLHLAQDVDDVAQGVYSYHVRLKTMSGKDKEYFGKVVKLP